MFLFSTDHIQQIVNNMKKNGEEDIAIFLEYNYLQKLLPGFPYLLISEYKNFYHINPNSQNRADSIFLQEKFAKLPTLEDANKHNPTLLECIEESANNIKDYYITTSKKPCLFWSGGIDSTTVFYALVKLDIPFYVITDVSNIEYKKLFNEIFVEKKFKNVYPIAYDPEHPKELPKDAFFVTGEIGDQIFGSMVTLNFSKEERSYSIEKAIEVDLFRHIQQRDPDTPCYTPSEYLKNTPEINLTKVLTEIPASTVYKVLKTNAQSTTVAEFLWAVNFIYKYILVLTRLIKIGLIGFGKYKNTFHFFDTQKFQEYALCNYKENNSWKKITDYKLPLKKYIYSQNNDLDFFINGKKIPSLKQTSYWKKN